MSGAMRSKSQMAIWLALLLLGLAASAYYLWREPVPDAHAGHGHGDGAMAPEPLFPFPPDELSAVEIVHGGALIRFERDAEGHWFRHQHVHAAEAAVSGHEHKSDEGEAERLAKAFRLLAGARYERVLTGGPLLDRRPFGLTFPPLIAMAYRSGQVPPALTLEFGDLAPDTLSRYVLVPQRMQILLLPDYQFAGLRALAGSSEQAGEETTND